MKVCFVFQRSFTPVAHKIAKELKKRGVAQSFCGYVYLRPSFAFLRRQTDIPYSSLLLDEDIAKESTSVTIDWPYVRELETQYGIPNLWPYLAVDRIIRYGQHLREYPHNTPMYSYEDMVRLLQTSAQHIIAFLEQEKPGVVFMPVVSSLGNMLLFHIAKKKGIRVLVGAETRMEGGYCLSEDYSSFTFAEQRFRELLAGASSPKSDAARSYITDYRKRPHTYHYVMESYKRSGSRAAAFAWLAPMRLMRSVSWNLRYIVSYAREGSHDYSDRPALGFLIDTFRRKFRLVRGFNDLYDRYDPREEFAYFPLHLEPEMSLLLLAPRWTDQLNVIKQVAESLPLSFRLYVKEHPAMVGFRTRAYYRELKKIPNVRLIHPNHDSHAIIQDARLIATITGTVGWEAALLGKPVITFGNVYYNALPTVQKCERIDDLALLVKEQLETEPDDRALTSFVAALFEHSEHLRLHELWEKGVEPEAEKAAIEGFCGLFERYVRG